MLFTTGPQGLRPLIITIPVITILTTSSFILFFVLHITAELPFLDEGFNLHLQLLKIVHVMPDILMKHIVLIMVSS